MRKIYVIDTSVLLYDRTSVHNFVGNDVVLPVVVLDELDKFKDREGILGESARYVNRYLDGLRGRGKLSEGVYVEEHDVEITIVDWAEEKGSTLSGFDMAKGDNRIILTAALAKGRFPDRKVVVVSKDINLRVKCDALGLEAQDYLRDRVVRDRESMYTGCLEIEVSPAAIDSFYSTGYLPAEVGGEELLPNQLIVLSADDGTNKSAICTTSCKVPTPTSKMKQGTRGERDPLEEMSSSSSRSSSSKSRSILDISNSSNILSIDNTISIDSSSNTTNVSIDSSSIEDSSESDPDSWRSIYFNIDNKAIRAGHRYLTPIQHTVADVYRVSPKSKEQKLALHLLSNPDVSLVTLTGLAGSGKTYLSLAAALSGLYSKQYERIVVTRSIEPVGRDIGFLPGDIKEKMAPWMNPFIDNFRQLLRDTTMFDMMIQKGQIEISPVTFIRGRSISDSFLIVDEAQNLTVHELKTIITRVGKNSKVVLMGDVDQIDTPYIDTLSNGLTITIERFKGNPMFGHVTLRTGERSELATLAAQLL
jgi:predicted ribonuclease YlaK